MNIFKLIVVVLLTGLCFQSHAQEKQSPTISYALFIEDAFLGGINHVSIEKTVFNGININNTHVVGISMGFGLGMAGVIVNNAGIAYCPMYLNYRCYFKKGIFSPYLNFSVGGMVLSEKEAWSSTLTAGFRKHKFTLSSGVFFHAYQYKYYGSRYADYSLLPVDKVEDKLTWEFPFGFILKLGVAF